MPSKPAQNATYLSGDGCVSATPECNATTLTNQTPRKRNPVLGMDLQYRLTRWGGDNFLGKPDRCCCFVLNPIGCKIVWITVHLVYDRLMPRPACGGNFSSL